MLPDPTKRVPLNPPLQTAPDPNQRGAIGLQINNLLSKVTQAIRTVENLISVTKTLNKRVKRTHQRVVDREWDIMEDMSRIGEQGNFETLRAVAAPKSSIGEDKANSNDGSDGRPKPSATEQDNPDVRDTTNHVAKWTTLGPNVEMRDAGTDSRPLSRNSLASHHASLSSSNCWYVEGLIESKGKGKGRAPEEMEKSD
ncbi:hypothetical protein RHS01_03158 [Rhizoctonia solani]|uniref:Uncharacterized protein n=1 Tax=Rhizoctonia solani TaxID=456999 RepID=A0A8H7M3U1_9AGAM|nr:hypothetical protein RHS01_03158 [Rhizoctonia solani]